MVEDLRGKTIYTDAPDYDARWVGKLFSAISQPLPFHCEHSDELLLSMVCSPSDFVWQAMVEIDKLKLEVAAVSSGKLVAVNIRPVMTSATCCIGYLLQWWRRANGSAVKMNHGIGPLPDTTYTGTFMRVKPISERHSRPNG